ncbi:hypothetical protein RSSM_04010 [Rhodopirellula sallentina SM41]|uniref:Uncharacterized protein n=1 Tax=Rhodopirellula sallentina SM41 TaxID=1263870 RepID=M5TZR9_9BACT|nr:hypothetical protein RSSM_04010 [Rhodopirellula sallentina SM41]
MDLVKDPGTRIFNKTHYSKTELTQTMSAGLLNANHGHDCPQNRSNQQESKQHAGT